jgi:hypothetical protein
MAFAVRSFIYDRLGRVPPGGTGQFGQSSAPFPQQHVPITGRHSYRMNVEPFAVELCHLLGGAR